MHREAKTRVERVSPMFIAEGPTVATSDMEAPPPKESCSRRVSLLSLYGTCCPDETEAEVEAEVANEVEAEERAAMTLPRADRLLLMLLASDRREPLLTVRRTRSEPGEREKTQKVDEV
jgi:hypothetical protein